MIARPSTPGPASRTTKATSSGAVDGGHRARPARPRCGRSGRRPRPSTSGRSRRNRTAARASVGEVLGGRRRSDRRSSRRRRGRRTGARRSPRGSGGRRSPGTACGRASDSSRSCGPEPLTSTAAGKGPSPSGIVRVPARVIPASALWKVGPPRPGTGRAAPGAGGGSAAATSSTFSRVSGKSSSRPATRSPRSPSPPRRASPRSVPPIDLTSKRTAPSSRSIAVTGMPLTPWSMLSRKAAEDARPALVGLDPEGDPQLRPPGSSIGPCQFPSSVRRRLDRLRQVRPRRSSRGSAASSGRPG